MILTSHQPNFLPYMGVIYKAYKSDAIVLSDDVCYSKKGMHNWNVIRAKNGSQKITMSARAFWQGNEDGKKFDPGTKIAGKAEQKMALGGI